MEKVLKKRLADCKHLLTNDPKNDKIVKDKK